jgi:hypothetical protein
MKNKIFSGYWGKCHCQGIAVDQKNGYLYYSFTTMLLKSDLEGNIIGSVSNIIGHLGCIAFHDGDGKIYASLEYKTDVIGSKILDKLGLADSTLRNGFYIAIFDVDKIDRMEMDAEKDGIMRAVYLKNPVEDYEGTVQVNGATIPRVHGCSGIDGTTFGPDFGSKDQKKFLHVCYGVYSDLERSDNDYQVILQYVADDWWDTLAKPLSQMAPHTCGPDMPRNKYFLYTGNTTYGIQNFEYDPYTGDYIACVYRGKKPEFPNYPMFVIDGRKAPKEEVLKGYDPEVKGMVLTLKETGLQQDGISGVDFPHGSTGFYAFGDGKFYVSEHFKNENEEQATNVCLYRLTITDGRWNFLCIEE